MPGCSTGTWTSGPTKAPSLDTWGLPVLQRIREEFSRQYPHAETISCEELTRHWQRLAADERLQAGRGRLRSQEHQAIALCVSQAFKDMDLKCIGRVSKDEWVHYMLLLQFGSPRVATQINSVLRVVLHQHPGLLGDLQKMFEVADTANTGWLTIDEIEEVYRREQWRLWISENGTLTCDANVSAIAPEKLANDIMKAMDLDDDGQISYIDFMSFCLGRRREEVLLNLYDLSNGSIPSISDWLLGEHIEGIWHCGIVVFGKEYYFGGELVYDTPGETCFGKPVKSVQLGITLWRRDELHAYIVNEMKPIFTRETYDVINNNCNHFANRVCQWLTGQGIPKTVRDQAKELMKLPATRALIPLLNRWLGNKYIEGNSVEKRPSGVTSCDDDDRYPKDFFHGVMRRGMIVQISPANGDGPPVLGTISGPELGTTPRSSGRECAINGRPLPTGVNGRAFSSSKSLSGLGLAEIAPSQNGSCWVTYFGPPTLSSRGSRGKVCTELLPHARISVVNLSDVGSEGLYHNSLRTMMIGSKDLGELLLQRCRGSASSGLSPMTPAIPGSMRENTPESPRLADMLDPIAKSLANRTKTVGRPGVSQALRTEDGELVTRISL